MDSIFPRSFAWVNPAVKAGNLHLVVSATAETHTLISHIQLSRPAFTRLAPF